MDCHKYPSRLSTIRKREKSAFRTNSSTICGQRWVVFTSVDYDYDLGLFPTNLLHTVVHISVGILGIAIATSLGGAIVFNQKFARLYSDCVDGSISIYTYPI
ncbi:DUF4383 domain-containing protein (plasmid) [Kovacikia minuta CCNUW1]|uniref:DUF4383 domain-containing protein n=1 Tax=Kovacikia minuta TaxID=2931930 RepID=UPI001CCF8F20|nr:DUF4383 domain-containing protein [Kovacikia minuta CCNUW1]